MATFSRTSNQTLLASGSLSASTTTANQVLDLSTKINATLDCRNTGGASVQAAATVTFNCFAVPDNTNPVTTANPTLQVTTVASTLQSAAIVLRGGTKWIITAKNNDSANATTVAILYDTVDGFA